MSNVTIKRYTDTGHGYLGTVEVDDGSWIVFIDLQGNPSLWLRSGDGYKPAP